MRSSVFCIMVLFIACASHAEDMLVAGSPRLIFAESPTIGTFEERTIGLTETISDKIANTGEAIDLFIARKKYTERRNDSHINISQLVGYSEGGPVRTSTDFGFNLSLPNVEKRWQLRFSSYDEAAESRDLNQRTLRTVAPPKDPGAALVFFRKLGNIRTSFQPRLELKNPLQVNYVLRFESAAEQKHLRFEPRMEFYADSVKGTGQYGEVRFTFKATQKSRWEYSFENDEEYRETDHFFSTHHGLGTSYSLSDSDGISAAVVASSENHPFHLTGFTVSTSYGKEIYSQLLKYSVSPYIGFGKSDNFKGRTGIALNLQVIF